MHPAWNTINLFKCGIHLVSKDDSVVITALTENRFSSKYKHNWEELAQWSFLLCSMENNFPPVGTIYKFLLKVKIPPLTTFQPVNIQMFPNFKPKHFTLKDGIHQPSISSCLVNNMIWPNSHGVKNMEG